MTKIQWTQAVWNPIAGCSVLSPGCTNCYAMRMAWRLSHNPATPQYHGTVKIVNGKPVWTGIINQAGDDTMTAPLRRGKPTIWFVNSMSDLFHEDVPDEWIDRVVAVMARCPQHQFQVLTKRAARMHSYASDRWVSERIVDQMWQMDTNHMADPAGFKAANPHGLPWPLPNFWVGVSAEDQRRADERIPLLLDTPAAVRFVSAEPLLRPIDLTGLDLSRYLGTALLDALRGDTRTPEGPYLSTARYSRLDWVIAGGESGPGARPCHVDWIRAIVAQCHDAGVPVFVKQLGSCFVDETNGVAGAGIRADPDVHITRRLSDRKGGDPSEWPADLRIREMPQCPTKT